ncbi:MAG: hypothetical protein Q8N44_14960, partial [Rubrivivax sp.]|nr:hypothetical protein [Rubrivivax sp.]
MNLDPRRTSPGQRMALFGIVASVMFALPAVHVLDDLGAVLAEVRAQASGLDPLRRAVALQRDLQAHRQLSDRVLRGDQTVEPQRAARQIEVDGDLSALDTQLGQMALQRARREVLAMQADWPPLAERVSERRIDAAESLDAHALLIEQTLQLIDLVADANRLQAWVDPGERQLARALTEHLPRWSEAQAQWRAAQQSGAAAALPAIAAQHRQAQARL